MRTVLWNIYAWPLTAIFIALVIAGIGRMAPIDAFDLAFTFPSLLALHLFIWRKYLFSKRFWQSYAIVFLLWDLAYNIYIKPHSLGKPFDPSLFVVLAVLFPLYWSLFAYAFYAQNKCPASA